MSSRKDLSAIDEWVHQHRAHWSYDRLSKFIRRGERVLSLGAGDCRLDDFLQQQLGCEVSSLDVADYNETNRHLTLYDGMKIPFADNTFDVILLIFSLHHAEDPKAVLREARRVCRGRLIVFEDLVASASDRVVFRLFHRFLRWSQGFPLPNHELPPDRWTQLASEVGLIESRQEPIGRSLGYFASSHVCFVWKKESV